jgi:hypothetical protein
MFSNDASRNLDDITKNIYKENVQLTDAFNLHAKEVEQLKKVNARLMHENEQLRGHSDGNDALVKEKIDTAAKQAKFIKDVILVTY